jgi:adenylate kinase family enzyme
LRKEVKAKTPEGKVINAKFKAYEFVDDKLVIDIVHKEIRKCEENGESWICQGFPRTYAQALSL